MNVLDLFSGIGGFSLGLERAGMRTVAFCEIDPFCRRVLAERWPDVPNLGDVCSADFPTADIITAGFPCQDISSAGNRTERAALAGERSGLFWEVIRAVRLVRPKFVILENVAILLARGMGVVLGALAARGYDAQWDCVPAAAIGAPCVRDRVFVVAHPHGGGGLEECDFFPQAGLTASRRRNAHGLDLATTGPWSAMPAVCRVDYGIPGTMDRLTALGNAVVPQIPEIIGRAIMSSCAEITKKETHDAITELELLRLIEACSDCQCPPDFPCFCAGNLQWAERKLEELRSRNPAIVTDAAASNTQHIAQEPGVPR